MLYLGIDQHKRQLTVNLRGEDGTVIRADEFCTHPRSSAVPISGFRFSMARQRPLPVAGPRYKTGPFSREIGPGDRLHYC